MPNPDAPKRNRKEVSKDYREYLASQKAKGIIPPEAVHTPPPHNMNDMTGVVVLEVLIDENGKVQQPKIMRPVGYGLDDEAVATLLTWSFKPATREGKPVPMHMAIEAAFPGYS